MELANALDNNAPLPLPAQNLAEKMGIDELLGQKRQDILRIAAQHGASNVRIFGSVARGEARPDSDVDFLVELESERSLLAHVALIQDLSDLLGRKVDVATDKGLRERIRDRILNEAVSFVTDDRLYLTDIAERIERIQTYTQGRLLGSGTYWIHDYLGIDVNEVWKAVERNLPNFKTKSNEILRELTTDA